MLIDDDKHKEALKQASEINAIKKRFKDDPDACRAQIQALRKNATMALLNITEEEYVERGHKEIDDAFVEGVMLL